MTLEITEELRRDLHLPIDCGQFDATRQVWTVIASELKRYRPDVYSMLTQEDDDK